MSTRLSPEAVDLLLVCCELGRWHVVATNICPVAQLLERGFVTAVDDYDNIAIFIADKGRRYARKQGWIISAPQGLYEPWARTILGSQACNFIVDRP